MSSIKLSSFPLFIFSEIEFKSTSTKISLSKELINQVPDALISILPSDLIEVFPPAA